MKKIIFLIALFIGFAGTAQIDGFSYQAVIANPDTQEIPGENVVANYLGYSDIQLRFSIFDELGASIYQEVIATRTDRFGMVSVIVGRDIPEFSTIEWDGTTKVLKVEALLNGSFSTIDTKTFTYTPIEFHRDISASGNFTVDGLVDFEKDLVVKGTTQLNDTLTVSQNSNTQLTGKLTVDEPTLLNSSLTVERNRNTSLTGSLTVFGESQLKSRLRVEDSTLLNNTLSVNGATNLRSTLLVKQAATLENNLTVDLSKATLLTGNLTVNGTTDLNDDVAIANSSELQLSGNLNVDDDTLIDGDLTVDGTTDLNKALSVNNGRTTLLKWTLDVDGQTELQDQLLVLGQTDLESVLRVNNQSPTTFTGTLDVDLTTNLNSALTVNNQSLTSFSGPLNVQGEIDLDNDLTVNGFTNLNNALQVNNAAPTLLSGSMQVNGSTQMESTLVVDGATTFNNNLEVTNGSSTTLTGLLNVNGVTTLNNNLEVLNTSNTELNGELSVDGVSTLNSELNITNEASTRFTGLMNVIETSLFNAGLTVGNNTSTNLTGELTVDQLGSFNVLSVSNASPTVLSGILNVEGTTTLNDLTTINGFTNANGDFTVTGLADFQNLSTNALTVSDDNLESVATFSSTFDGDDTNGIVIRLGKNHPRFVNGIFIGANEVTGNGAPSPSTIDLIKSKFQATSVITLQEMFTLAPDLIQLGALPNINNIVFNEINARFSSISFPGVDFPNRDFPDVPGFPGTSEPGVIFPGITFFNGLDAICSGQACFSICFPFAGCTTICIPPVNVCVPSIPKIEFPRVALNGFNISPSIPNFIPPIPGLPTSELSPINFPDLPDEIVFNHLDNDNEFAVFQDTDGRVLGSIRAESIQDFFGRTIEDDVYMVNVLSEFVGLDMAKVKIKAAVRMVKLVLEYNKSGLEYSSGNGDYAEWLERESPSEYISSGDIVGVIGGKISKNLENAEQVMVVSNRPIVLGNAPEPEKDHLGNIIAFIGQIPVKIIGPVHSGDYIVPHDTLLGYGKAVRPEKMELTQYKNAVGRSWEENLNDGPKLVNTVVGIQNGDWKNETKKVEETQKALDAKLEALEKRLQDVAFKLNTTVN